MELNKSLGLNVGYRRSNFCPQDSNLRQGSQSSNLRQGSQDSNLRQGLQDTNLRQGSQDSNLRQGSQDSNLRQSSTTKFRSNRSGDTPQLRQPSSAAAVASAGSVDRQPIISIQSSPASLCDTLIPSPSCRSCMQQKPFMGVDFQKLFTGKGLSKQQKIGVDFHKLFTGKGRSNYALTTMVTVSIMVLIFTLNFGQTEARSVGVCRGVPCANGGRLMVDNSVWGHCRCKCPRGFLGPYCQFQAVSKRSGVDTSFTVAPDRSFIRLERFELIRRRLLALYATMAGSSSSATEEMANDDYSDLRNNDYKDTFRSSNIDYDTLDQAIRLQYLKNYRR